MKKLFTLIMSLIMSVTACLGLTACGKQLVGFDIDLATEVLAYVNEKNNANLRIEFVEIDWNAKETLLENGTIDLVWNGMTITEERQTNMCISIPYLYNKQVAVVRVADIDTYTSIPSMATANVGAEAGSAGEDIIEALKEVQVITGEYISAPSQLDALTQLNNGTIDVAVIDSVMAGYYTSNGVYKDRLVIVEDLVLATEEYGIAAKKGNDALISVINDALINLRTTKYLDVANEYGLTGSLCITETTTNPLANATDNSWANILDAGRIVIGYTVFAPIAFIS